MTVVRIDKVSYRTKPIFESLYLGMPWTEIDYLMGPATCVPLYQQLKAEFPEVQAVNAMYTHGLLAIISTKTLRRLCPRGGAARNDDAAWPGLRENGDYG
jgi:UbiD family decarboxylase